MLNYNHLFYFYVAVKEGGISAGARKLGLTQPALSTQIKQFEQSLNETLLIRGAGGIDLTDRGRTVFEYARRMFDLSDELVAALQARKSSKSDLVRLGVANDIEKPFSVRLARLLREEPAPPPTIRLLSGEHGSLLDLLGREELDAVLTDHPPQQPGMVVLGRLYMRIVLVGRRQPKRLVASAAKNRTKRGGELAQVLGRMPAGIVVPSPKLRFRAEIDEFLGRHQVTPEIAFEGDFMAAVVRAVTDGVGPGFLPLPYAWEGIRKGELEIIGPPTGLWQTLVMLVARDDKKPESKIPILQKVFDRFARETNELMPKPASVSRARAKTSARSAK